MHSRPGSYRHGEPVPSIHLVPAIYNSPMEPVSKLLALETSSATGTVALAIGDEVRERTIATAREQSEQILPAVAALLDEAGLDLRSLDAIAFGRGPGSFTGLRIAAAVAQGLALASGRPIVPVSSFAGLAQRAWRERGIERCLICVDARMGEVYVAQYRIVDALAECTDAERLAVPAAAMLPADRGWSAVGDGFAAYPEVFAGLAERADSVVTELVPGARDLVARARADLARGLDARIGAAQPSYLRGADAWKRQ